MTHPQLGLFLLNGRARPLFAVSSEMGRVPRRWIDQVHGYGHGLDQVIVQ